MQFKLSLVVDSTGMVCCNFVSYFIEPATGSAPPFHYATKKVLMIVLGRVDEGLQNWRSVPRLEILNDRSDPGRLTPQLRLFAAVAAVSA